MGFNARLGNILDALKSISAQQFQSLERTLRLHETFFSAVETLAGTFDLEHIKHPFTQDSGPVGVIAVTSDSGLLGGLNQWVVSSAVQEYRQAPGQIMVIGERGLAFVEEYGLACQPFPGVQDSTRWELAGRVRDYALNQVLSGSLSALTIVYPRALSFTLQRVELIHALPCGVWFQERTVPRGVGEAAVLLESAFSEVLEYLVWFWLGRKLFDVFGLARLAELAARSTHLEGSSQELAHRGYMLRLKYFRQRRESIDRNIRELFSARSLYQNLPPTGVQENEEDTPHS